MSGLKYLIDHPQEVKQPEKRMGGIALLAQEGKEKNQGGIPGAIGYIAGRAGTDFLRVGEGVVDAALVPVDLLTGNVDRAKSRFVDSPVDAMRERLDAEYNPGKVAGFIGDIAGGMGQSIGYGLISAIPYAGTPMMYSSIVEQSISSAAEKTGEVGLKEVGYGATAGAVEGLLESKLGAGVSAAKGIGSAILKKTGLNVAESAAKAGGKTMLKSVLTETAKGAAGEFAEEAISEAVDPALLRLYNIDKNAQFSLKDVAYAGLIGGLSGGIMSAGPAAINYRSAVSVGRALQESRLDGDLINRAKYTLSALEASQTRSTSQIKGKPEGDAKETAKEWLSRTAENRKVKRLSKETAQLADKIRRNIAAYEKSMADPAMAQSEPVAALLGELRGNLFLVGYAYEADVIEQVMMEADDKQRQAFVDAINEELAAQGKKHDYTLADFDANKDDIRRGLAGLLMDDELQGYTTEYGAEAPKKPAQASTSPWDGMADNEDMSAYKAAGEAENALLKAAVNQSVPRGSVQAMLDEYRKGTDLTPEEFAEGWSDGVHLIGRYGLKVDETAESAYNRLPQSAREASTRIGKETAETERKAAEEKAKAKKKPAAQAGKKGTVVRGEGLNIQKLSDEQYAAYKGAEVLAEVLGTEVVIENSIEERGHTVNGYFDLKTNRIHININALRNGKNIALYTLGHEVTHYIKEWSPDKFEALADFVLEQMSVDAETAIADKLASLKRMGIVKDTMTVAEANALAREELVAEGMELVLTDGKVLEELAHTDRSIWQKVKAWIQNIISKIRKYYGELNQASKTAQVLKETVESLEEIERLFTEGVTEAGERTRTAGVENTLEDNGSPTRKYLISEEISSTLSAEDQNLLFDTDFYERYENESREPITETVEELEAVKASEAFAAMSDDEVFDLNAKLKAKRAGYDTVYDYYVETEKERTEEEYRRYVQTGRSNRTSRTLEEKRKKAQKERTLRSDEASATPLQNAQYKIIQETNPMWDEYHTGIRSSKEIKTFAEVAEDPDSFTWGDFTREDARKALRDGTVRVYSSYAIKNGVFVSTSYQQALEYAGNDPARVHSRVVALDSVAWINGDEGQYAKVYKDDGIRYSIDEDSDTAYLAAVERGDMVIAQRMVNEAAKKWGAIVDETTKTKRPLHLYHGSRDFGFTQFNERAIFATVKESVAAGYNSGDGLGRVRNASVKYIPNDGTVETAIKNAKSVLGRNLSRLNDSAKQEIVSKADRILKEVARRISDIDEAIDYSKAEKFFDYLTEKYGEDASMKWTNQLDNMKYMISGEYTAEEILENGEWLEHDLERYSEWKRSLNELWLEEREEIENATLGDAFRYVLGYDYGDKVIDIEFGLGRLLNEREKLVNPNGSLVYLDDIIADIEEKKSTGVYDLYGHAGEKPLIIDEGDRFWDAIPFDGGFRSTDYIVKWAKNHGYTSVNLKSIMDPSSGGSENVYADEWVFFSADQVKSADPVTYDDNGNVIPLSERFKEDDSDIRYSIDETPENADVSDSPFDEALRRAGLSHLVEDTAEAEDTETTPPPHKAPRERDPEEDRLERIRAHETLANALMEAAQNEHEFRLVKNYRQKAAELADAEVRKEDLRKKTAEVNREIDALQDKLRGVDKSKREPWVMTALTDAQKRKGELLDEMDALDEKLRAETDKLLSLASAKQLRKLIRAERSKAAAMERSAERARQREMDSKEWAKETVKKAREESEEKVKKARQEAQDYKAAVYKTSMDKVYKARREAIDYKRAVYHTAYAKADEKNQKYRDRLDEMAKQSMERKEITIRMREARRVLGYLNTMLYHPTKQKHVPESLQALVEKALRSADPKQFGINRDHIREMSELAGKIRKLESKAGRTTEEQKTLDAMKTKYEKLEADTISVKRQAEALMTAFEQYVTSTADGDQIDKNMLEGLRQTVTEIEEAPLNEMTLKSLQAVEKIYTVIYHQVNTANQAFATEKAANIDEMSTEANTQVKNAKELKVLSPRSREWAALAGVRSFLWKNMKPLTVFEAIGSDKLMEIFRRVLDAEDVWITDILEAKKALDEAKKEFGYNKWNLKERREVTTADGSKVSLTLGEMMSLYAYMFREQAEEHLSAGGFVFAPNAEAIESFKGDKVKYRTHLNDQTPHRMRPEDIAKMSALLTEEQRAYARAVQEYLTSLGAKGNEVSRKLYGIDLFKETAYFPIKSSHDYIETQTGKSGDPNIKSRGTFKETVPKAGNPIVLEDFMEVVGNHVNTMATYHAFVLPVEDLTRVWNYTPVNIKRDADGKAILDENGMPVADTEGEAGYNSLKAEITKKYGKEANDYILQLLRDLNGGARRESAASILDKGLTAFKRSATMLSLSTIVQQPTSIIRAMAYVDAKHFTGASFVPWETVKKYAPVAAIKEVGGHDTNTGARTVDYINAKQYDSIKDAAKAAVTPEIYGGDPNVRAEAFGWLTGKADEVSWRYMFGAIVNEQAEKLGKAKDSEEVLKAAGKRFAEVVRRTQVYDSTLTRSEFMRSKDGLMKMATAFGAEPTTILSMAAEAIVKLERGDKAFFRKTAGAVAASILVNAVISSIIYAMRDDDEEKNILEKYTESVTSEIIEGFNPLEYLPIARDVMSVFKGYDIERTDMSLISNLYQQIELLTSSKRSPADKIAGVSGAVGAFFGLPITNVYRDAKGIVLTTAGILDPEPVTGRGMGNAVGQGIKGQAGLLGKIFGKEKGDSYELYKAYVKGDKAHYDRVAARYKTEADLEYALRRELRENDKRIVEAAEAKHSGDLAVYESIVDQIEAEGIFDRNIVIRAINNEVSELKRADEKGELVPKDETATDEEETAESLYTSSDLNNALERGDTEDFAAILSALVEDKVSAGKTEAQAKSSVKSSITAYWKKQYLSGYQDTETRKRIIAILTETGLYGSRNDVATMCEGWVKARK